MALRFCVTEDLFWLYAICASWRGQRLLPVGGKHEESARVIKDSFLAAIFERHDSNTGFVVVRRNGGHGEQHCFSAWQSVWQAMAQFSRISLSKRSHSPIRRDPSQTSARIQRCDDAAVFTPSRTSAGGSVAQGNGFVALQPSFLQFSCSEESDPLPIRGKKGAYAPCVPGTGLELDSSSLRVERRFVPSEDRETSTIRFPSGERIAVGPPELASVTASAPRSRST